MLTRTLEAVIVIEIIAIVAFLIGLVILAALP
jgi:hypothetical protein